MRRTALALALSAAAAHAPLQAQGAPLLPPPGTRVRVAVPTIRAPIVGELQGAEPGQVLVRIEGGANPPESILIPYEQVRSLEVSRGRLTSGQGALRGARQGLAGGAMVGTILGALLSLTRQYQADMRQSGREFSFWESAARWGGAGAVAGVAAGALAGRREREQWEGFTLSRLGLRAHPEAGGLVVAIRP